ncbi:MAG: Uma2 family endonuclease [Bryobacterales bacterium]|nr:Uma2 family endonuclease [Bryobacterales bacterium]
MSSQPKTFLTPQEYLEIERKAEYKSEYYAGEMFAMSGGTDTHALLGFHVLGLLYRELRGGSCRAYTSDMRICLGENGPYYYPDASVVCGESKFTDKRRDSLLNPVVIFEILSPSTATYDLGEKFMQYQRIDSLREYVVVHQDSILVQRFERREDGQWLAAFHNGLEGMVTLSSVPCALPMAEIYEGIQ